MGFGLANKFTDHLQVVTTNNYKTNADFHTTNQSTLSFLSLHKSYSGNGYITVSV
jgi:hypothetical protein